mgnify:FL=1
MNDPNDDEDSIIFYKEEKELHWKGIDKPSNQLYKELWEKMKHQDWVKKFNYLMSKCLIPVPENYFEEKMLYSDPEEL